MKLFNKLKKGSIADSFSKRTKAIYTVLLIIGILVAWKGKGCNWMATKYENTWATKQLKEKLPVLETTMNSKFESLKKDYETKLSELKKELETKCEKSEAKLEKRVYRLERSRNRRK